MIGEAKFHATARFEDGKASVKVTAVTPYGDRSTSTVREIDDPKTVKAFEKLFAEVVDAAADEMVRHGFNEAAVNVVAAIHRGEDVHAPQQPHVRVPNYDELQKERQATAKRVQAELGVKPTKEK